MKHRSTIREVDGKEYLFFDIGCADFERAAQNRKLVAEKLCTEFWVRLEGTLRDLDPREPLPDWIPTNRFYQADKEGKNYESLL